MNRRDLFIATAATASALCGSHLGRAIASPDETPILRHYREYSRITDEAEAFWKANTFASGREEDEVLDRLFYDERDRIEAEMMALPCTCAADFAAKVIVDTARGGVFSDWETGAIWQEARALVEVSA